MEQRVWFDAAMAPVEFVCPVCHDDRPKPGYLRVARTNGNIEKLYRCNSCAALTYHPLPAPDYSNHTASDLVIRDYVELNAGVDIHARQVFDLCVLPKGRLLDIGCGLGFGLDFATQYLGWEAVGFEPSTYGSEGVRLLGVDIRPEFATLNDDTANRFDVVYCSEVLEHVEDPWSFLRLLTSHVTDDGMLFLTTPNPERIVPGAPGAEELALLSPGYHMTLLPPDAIGGMLTVLGFKSVVVDRSQASTRIFASRTSRVPERRAGFDEAYPRYLEGLIARLKPHSPIYNGIRYRLYRWFCDRGEWQGADKWYDPALVAPYPELADLRSFDDYADRFPLCVAPATYCRGMQLINDKGDYAGAAQHFHAAYQLCRKKIGLDQGTSVGEEDILYHALFHQALALNFARRNDEAGRVLDELCTPGIVPPVPANLLERARNLRLKLAA